MRYAELAVNSPGSQSTFCYAIPPQLDIDVGQAVWVPFGSRVIQGIVVELSDQPSVEVTKEIAKIITDYPLLSPRQIELARWVSQHYLSPLFNSIALMLPPGFERQTITYFQYREGTSPGDSTPTKDLPPLTPEQTQALRLIREKEKMSFKELERKFGPKKAKQICDQLLHYHLVMKSQEPEKAKVKPKSLPYVKLIAGKDEIEDKTARLNKSRAYKQAAVLEFLSQQTQPIAANEVRKRLDCSLESIRALERHRLLSIELVNIRRDPLSRLKLKPGLPPPFTSSQQAAWKIIADNWTKRDDHGSPPVFLLFGVTGSG
ncbi:MAG TPA: hypothetical protein VMW45_04230, partial [Dehalococcoidia bacterium]|nr:hypothetical protein [Dehalococcoidia bacterium]